MYRCSFIPGLPVGFEIMFPIIHCANIKKVPPVAGLRSIMVVTFTDSGTFAQKISDPQRECPVAVFSTFLVLADIIQALQVIQRYKHMVAEF